MEPPAPRALRARLARLDTRSRRIVGGLLAQLADAPARVQDRAWLAEQLAFLALVAEGMDPGSELSDPAALEGFLARDAEELLECTLQLYRRVGADLAERSGGFQPADALEVARDYLE